MAEKTWKDLKAPERKITPSGYVKPEKRELAEAELEAKRDEIKAWVRSFVDEQPFPVRYEAIAKNCPIGHPSAVDIYECIAAVDKERDPEKFVVEETIKDEELIGGTK